jgi:hypothetical protein
MLDLQHLMNLATARTVRFNPTNPSGTRVAAILQGVPNIGTAQVADTRIGLGRVNGYDSLANARRAAYMLTRGELRPAAGVYQQGDRFYVRAMGDFVPQQGQSLLQLHLEGTRAVLTGLQDLRLRLMVDGSTKLFPS